MVDFREKLDKGVFVIFSKWLSGLRSRDGDLEKLVREVDKKVGNFQDKEKEIAYSLIASGLCAEQSTHLTTVYSAIAVLVSFTSLFPNYKNNLVSILFLLIISIGILLLAFRLSASYHRNMLIDHVAYEILSKRP